MTNSLILSYDAKKPPKNAITCAVMFSLGIVSGLLKALIFPLSSLWEHFCINGGTGRGKSMLAQKIFRQLIDQRMLGCVDQLAGGTYMDPHGDAVEDLMLYIAAKPSGPAKDRLLAKLIYLKPSPEMTFAYDPFESINRPGTDFKSVQYRDSLRARSDRVAKILIRKQGEADFEGKPRLERFLKDAIFACGVAYDEKGSHLGLTMMEAILTPMHPDHERAFKLVAPHLPPEILADFRKVKSEKRAKDQEAWVESSINRIRGALCSDTIYAMFSQQKPTIDWKKIKQEGYIVLVNLRYSDSLSVDGAQMIGGLIMQDLINASDELASMLPNINDRTTHVFFVDEAERYLGSDMGFGLAEHRKKRLVFGFGFQDLSCARKEGLDLVPKLISQCGLQISFQQKFKDDNDLLAWFYALPNLDLTMATEERDRHGGYRKVLTRSVGLTRSNQRSESVSQSLGAAIAQSKQTSTAVNTQSQQSLSLNYSEGEGETEHWSRGNSESEMVGEQNSVSNGRTKGRQEGHTASQNEAESNTSGVGSSRAIREGEINATLGSNTQAARARMAGQGKSDSVAVSEAESESETLGNNYALTLANNNSRGGGLSASRNWGVAITDGNGQGRTLSEGNGITGTRSASLAQSLGESDGRSVTISLNESYLADIRTEQVPTGRLVTPIEVQMMRYAQALRVMPKQHCMFSLNDGAAGVMKVHDVPDPYVAQGMSWVTDAWRRAVVTRLREQIYARQNFYFVPQPRVQVQALSASPAGESFADDEENPIA